MLVVKVELHSAVTGEVSELGRMIIANDGRRTREDPKRGTYEVFVGRKGQENIEILRTPQRRARVENYPRWSYVVWELVRRALNAAYSKGEDILLEDPDETPTVP